MPTITTKINGDLALQFETLMARWATKTAYSSWISLVRIVQGQDVEIYTAVESDEGDQRMGVDLPDVSLTGSHATIIAAALRDDLYNAVCDLAHRWGVTPATVYAIAIKRLVDGQDWELMSEQPLIPGKSGWLSGLKSLNIQRGEREEVPLSPIQVRLDEQEGIIHRVNLPLFPIRSTPRFENPHWSPAPSE
tara:strand:- start:3393 stop:3968 length:576 start_codon:yes stop_codon:yes gene_type:complete